MNGIVLNAVRPSERAKQIDRRMHELFEMANRSFIELGLLCTEVEERNLYEYLHDKNGEVCRSHDHWMSHGLPFSRSYAYKAKRTYNELCHLPLEDLMQIAPGNLDVLVDISRNDRHNWLKQAKELKYDDFVSLIKRERPNLHLEHLHKMILKLSETDKAVIEDGIKKFREEDGEATREAVVVAWAREYLS